MNNNHEYKWLSEQEKEKPFKATKRGYMSVPLNRETFEEMQAASVFTEQWLTQPKQIMKKDRLFRINIHMYKTDGTREISVAQMEDCDNVNTLWGAIDEMSSEILDRNPGALWNENKCKAVVRV